MLKWRITSAIIGLALLGFFVFWGSWQFFLFTTILMIITINEYIKLVPEKYRINSYLMTFLSTVIFIYLYLHNTGIIDWKIGFIFIITLFIMFIYNLIKGNKEFILEKVGINFFGFIYITGGFTYLVLLRDYDHYIFKKTSALWLALLATWAVDTGAYFSGRYFGKRKLAEKISPNKTIEGALGGIILTVIVVVIYTNYQHIFTPSWILFGIVLAVLAILGDLFESILKRNANIKDTGDLMPGHGGLLDRFDSLLFTLPFTYYYLLIFHLG